MGDRGRSASRDEAAIVEAFAAGEKALRSVGLSIDDFAAYLDRHELQTAGISHEIARDLFLACACSINAPNALRTFREQYLPVVAQTVRSFDSSSSFAEEIYQRLSESLFVGHGGGRGKIVRYTGQGTLAGFVTTSARRIALRMTASSAKFQGEDALVQQFSEIQEQETTMLKMQHRETFNRALSLALHELTSRERLILRMNLIERVSTTRIATIYKVSQPTVSRWIQRAARTIFATVKDLVCDELDIDTRELDSLLLVVRSQIEITISQGDGGSSP